MGERRRGLIRLHDRVKADLIQDQARSFTGFVPPMDVSTPKSEIRVISRNLDQERPFATEAMSE